MRLYIVRHGKAERDSPTGREADRRLRPRGERQSVFLGEIFCACDDPPTLILASRYTRALHTARVIHEAVGCELRLAPELELGSYVAEAVALMRDHASFDPLMLVGHNPQLEDLIDVLLQGPAGAGTRLRTGEAAALDVEVDKLDPDSLRTCAELIEMIRLEEE
ncbi:MAG: hypothetical protein EA376_03140 [Phycisphaeraceae bacterium]|nr:MAG: hypothetical protein EA376_03140 [Phycisphaeraceae bacterium]